MNSKQTVIIAEENSTTLKEMVDQFAKEYEVVASTNDGQKLFDLIKKHSPQVVIMDVVLSSIDGFVVMEKLREEGLTPTIIIHSALALDGFINKALSLGAKYYCIKPFDIELLVQRVTEVLTDGSSTNTMYSQDDLVPSKKVTMLEEKISNIFITVGIPAHIKGYQFLREAIKLAVKSPDMINNITKKLYPSIADKFSTSSSKVERAIRHAIEVAWNRGKIENINSLFGIKVYNSSEKPTNGEFIALVADKMIIEGA